MLEDIRQFLHNQRAALKRADLECFLCDMVNFFRELSASRAMQGHHLLSREFDAMCQAAGQLSAYELLGKVNNLPSKIHDVILVTELFCMGGHAELVRDIIRKSEVPILLLVTNINERKNPILKSILEEENLLDIISLDDFSFLNRLQSVQTVLANSHVKTIFMLNHAYDAVAVSAVAPDNDKNILFLHHCDHSPALGCYIEGAHHVDLHNVGFSRCRHNLNITNNRYLCMTSMNLHNPRRNWVFADPCFKTASCGGLHKIESFPYHIHYKDLVLHVLKKHNGVHFHIGNLSDEFLHDMQQLLLQNGFLVEQFVYMGDAHRVPEILTQLEIDLYLPTLPISGGKTVIEVMCAGIPILTHQSAIDRMCGSIDLIYPSAPSWSTLEELDKVLDLYDEEFWLNQVRDSRAYFERYHSDSLFLKQLASGGVNVDSGDIPEMKIYRPDIAHNLMYAGFRQ